MTGSEADTPAHSALHDSTQPLDPVTAAEIAVEQRHVDAVYERLDIAAGAARRLQRDGSALFPTDRGSYLREEDGTAVLERDVFAFQAAKRLATLDAEHEGLVFGRLDLADRDIRYIGRIGVRDDEYEPLVIDWRAPAAEPFYRATPTNPMDVVRRRVLRCSGDRVIDLSDDLLDADRSGELVIVGDGALMAALSRARGLQMRDIVATIQAEQDEAIRAPYAGFTMISGGPGTGKTVVALHRAAYLLYSNRRRFENGGVLVVGPSGVFMNYIQRVLPSLGEEAVTLRPIGGVASDVLGETAERVDDPDVAKIKGSLRMLRLLRRLVNEPLGQVPVLRVMVKGEALTLHPETLARIRADVLRQHKVNRGREPGEQAVRNTLWQRWQQLRPDLGLDRDQFDDIVTSTAAWQMFGNAWWPVLTAPDVLARLADESLTERLSANLLSPAEVRGLAGSYARNDTWSVADTALLDELVDLIGVAPQAEPEDPLLFLTEGASVQEVVTTADRLSYVREVDPFADPYDTFAHVLVDEAQDITPMQWRMLRRRGASASWTVVGDPAQSSWPDPAETAAALEQLTGTAPRRAFHMSTNYRSPAEVFTLAGRVVRTAVPDADLPEAVRSTGVEPLLLTAGPDWRGEVADRVRDLAAELEGTIGVIAPVELVAAVTDRLDTDPRLTPDRARIVVLTALQSKGLEYDGVVVVAPDRIVAEATPHGSDRHAASTGIRLLYVALTRPTQRLVTIDLPGDAAAWRRSAGLPATSSV